MLERNYISWQQKGKHINKKHKKISIFEILNFSNSMPIK